MARPRNFDEQDVLRKAINLFWRQGYKATSMEDLVQVLGISRASLYDTFGDKHQLYLRALGEYDKESNEVATSLLRPDRPAPEAIRDLLEAAMASSTGTDRQWGCFMVNSLIELAPHDEDVALLVSRQQRNLEEQLTNVLVRGQAEGTIARHYAPEALVAFIFNTITGVRALGKTQSSPATLRAVVDIAMSTLLVPATT
jgi:TetR/AcrR family transcriptional repressor of nem operon